MSSAIPNRGKANHATTGACRTKRAFCPRGCTAVTHVIHHATDGLDAPWRVVQCQHCELMFTDPRPPVDDWHLYYPSDYHPYQVKPPVRWRKRIARTFESQLARHGGKGLLRHVASMLLDPTIVPPAGSRRMVDIGCGAADYMVRLRDAGWDVVGLEPSPYAAARARETYGVTVLEDTFPSKKLTAGSFDLVTAQQVLEHLENPLVALKSMRELLRPEGRLMITVPNASSWSSTFFGAAWIGWDVPRHLTHFTPNTLSTMAEECGFKVLRVQSIRQGGWIRTSAALAEGVGLPRSRGWFQSRQISNAAVSVARWMDRSDSLMLLAQRTE